MHNVDQDAQALAQKVAILTRLTEISTILTSTLKIKPLLKYIMDAAAEVTNAEAASVLLWDSKSNELRFAATTSTGKTAQDLIGKPVPLERSIAGTVLRDKRVVAVNDVASEPRHYAKVDEEIEFHTRSVLGVPMTSKNRVIGVLEAVNKRQIPWTEDDTYYLSIVAAQAAVAIEAAQLVAAQQKANEELSQLDKMKNDFIAIASHELRTPLGVILGYASILSEHDDRMVSDSASKVVDSAMQLRSIVEDLTNLRYLQAEDADLDREYIELAEIFHDLERDIAPQAEAHEHSLRFIPPPPDVVVYVDRIRMGMALAYVLHNAVRFTPPGGHILVQAEIRTSSEVWVSVQDNGIGITRDQIERIFDKFYQVEDHMTRKHGGLGIGLSIARALVEAHGGKIWASSPGLNQGATFTLSIPMMSVH